MVKKIKTFTNIWLESYEIEVEIDSNKSLPWIEIVWLPDTAIKEAKERIRSSFKNIWIQLPNRKFILNLSPSDIKKVGTRFDLPMAVAILSLIYEWSLTNEKLLNNSIFFGELWLDWTIKRVNWILPSVIWAYKKWYKDFFIPEENIYEVQFIKNINIYPISNFKQIYEYFIQNKRPSKIDNIDNLDNILSKLSTWNQIDFSDIKWQVFAKRVLSIAAAGLHNTLMIWPPWSWKTMLAKALANILPPLTFEEIIEVSKIYSIIWKLSKDKPLIVQRPFRIVHHTASKVSIIGWWNNLTPWEISLAHKWILFFDELPEFPRSVLETLRQPLEDKIINISRVHGTVQYPAQFMFVAAMNPCKCWYYKDKEKNCSCSINEIKKYQSKISWPLLDRFDIILEVYRENIDKILEKTPNDPSKKIKEKVIKAWEIQNKRFKEESINLNSEMNAKHIDKYIKMTSEAENLIKTAVKKLNLSPRVVHRLIKLARTIADFEWINIIDTNQIAEALQYRSKNMFINEQI